MPHKDDLTAPDTEREPFVGRDGSVLTRSKLVDLDRQMRKNGREATTPKLAAALLGADWAWDGIEDERELTFLSCLAVTGCVRTASRLANIDHTVLYRRRARKGPVDPETGYHKPNLLAQYWVEAQLQPGIDTLEEEAMRRALDGVEKPVYYKGERVDSIREYSDTLLLALLKANAPEKYGRKTEIKGTVNHNHQGEVGLVAKGKLSPAKRKVLADLTSELIHGMEEDPDDE